MKNLLSSLSFLFFLAAAPDVFAGSSPDWINGPSAQYPRDRYLTGVGIGDDRATAQDRARGEISRVFSALVTVNTNLSETERNTADALGKKTSTFSQTVSQSVKTVSQKLLEGVEIPETWQDTTAQRFYALAVLERAKGIVAMKDKISEFDRQAVQWKQQMEEAPERLPRVKAAMKLMATLKAREQVNSELRVLDPSGKGQPNPLNESIIRPEASKALSSLEIVVAVDGASSDEIETGIVKGLNSFGLQAKSGAPGGTSDIIVEGKVDMRKVEGDKSAWRWARSTVTVSLKDGKSGKIFLRFDASERQAAADQKEAGRRSLVKLSQKIAPAINEAITNYFENL